MRTFEPAGQRVQRRVCGAGIAVVADRHVRPGGQQVDIAGNNRSRALLVGDVVQHRAEQDPDRLPQIEITPGRLQRRRDIGEIGRQAPRVLVAFQHRPPVGHTQRVVVHIHNPHLPAPAFLRDDMERVASGESGTEIEKLPDPVALGRHPDSAGQPAPVHDMNIALLWRDPSDPLERPAIHLVAVLAAQAVVVDTGNAGPGEVPAHTVGPDRCGATGHHHVSSQTGRSPLIRGTSTVTRQH